MAPRVEFKKSGQTAEFTDRYDNILELAEDVGVEIESECRQGFCGSCQVKLLSGEVEMETTDGLEPEDEENNMILACVAAPKTDIVLDH